MSSLVAEPFQSEQLYKVGPRHLLPRNIFRRLQANSNLLRQQLMDVARQQNWGASMQALVAMPGALAKLTQDILIRYVHDLALLGRRP